jgi:hypothetical protein
MTAQVAKPHIKTKSKTKPRKRKLNTTKVIKLYKQGVIPSDIAKQQGVAISTVTRYLETIKPQLSEIQKYSDLKADALCLSQLKLQTISNTILDEWMADPEKLRSQDMRLQKEVLVAVQGAKTYEHAAERLERGQSTENVHQLVDVIQRIKAQDEGSNATSKL